MKDKIKQWFLENAPHLLGTQAERHFNDCIQDLGLSNEWVSVESDYPKDDDGPYWVLFPCGSVELMRLNLYTLYGGSKDFWQGYAGNDRFMNHTYYIKINKPLPPNEAKS